MPDELRITTNSPEETAALGAALVELLPLGAVVALKGDLGTGKTCMVQGMAGAIGADAVSSPSFTLVNEYHGERTLYHLDLYRLETAEDLFDLGYEEIFEPPNGLTAIEWAERAETLLPPRRFDVFLAHANGDRREIVLVNLGLAAEGWQAAMRSAPTPPASPPPSGASPPPSPPPSQV